MHRDEHSMGVLGVQHTGFMYNRLLQHQPLPCPQLGPNVSIGTGVTIGAGVRVRESIILHGATLQVLHPGDTLSDQLNTRDR